MKSLSSFLFLWVLSLTTLGQTKKVSLQNWYLEAGGGATNHSGALGAVGLRTILSNNWTFGLAYDNSSMDPKNLPADYRPGVILLLLLPISEGNPSVDLNTFSVTAGRHFPAGPRVWLTTDAGLSVASGKTFQFRPNQDRGGLLDFPSNYVYIEERKTTLGALLKAEVAWAFSGFAGISAGVFANLNGIQSPVGVSCKLLVGSLRKDAVWQSKKAPPQRPSLAQEESLARW